MINLVRCNKCGKEITEKKDYFALSFLGLSLNHYCAMCYAGKEKGVFRHFLSIPKKAPLNSLVGTVQVGFAFVAIIAIIIIFAANGFKSAEGEPFPIEIFAMLGIFFLFTLWLVIQRLQASGIESKLA